MSFFDYYFSIHGADKKEVAVCCPFNHSTTSGMLYKETNPSAHVNTEEKIFHCKACGTGHSEVSFIKAILNCTQINAIKLSKAFHNSEDIFQWQKHTNLSEVMKQRAMQFGISEEVIAELMISSMTRNALEFPVFMYDKLVDIRIYNPDDKPKVRSRVNATTGLIIPYDIWRVTPLHRLTLICAGEKDMAVARSKGFNAITLTGGENVPPLSLEEFKGRHVAIVYDNDAAGKQGAIKLAATLKPHCASIKNVTGFHEVCVVEKEDITDFFTKYNKTKEDLITYIENTPEFEIPEGVHINNYPIVNLLEASTPLRIGKLLRSNVQVVATSDATFIVPSEVLGEKLRETEDGKDTMYAGELREWSLCEDNAQDILHLMDNNFTELDVNKNLRNMLKIMQTEKYVRLKKLSKETVFKAYVTDMFETTTIDAVPMEYTVYSIGHKLESGKKYLVTYKLVPHPYKGQQLIMIVLDAVQANDSVSDFKINDVVKANLDVIRNITGTVPEKITELTEKVKGLLGYNGNNTLIQTIDFAYHTVLQFNLGQFKNVRGYLDTIIVGESRIGKSSTAETLRKTYNLGTFTSLAGNSATIPGLIGGSNKTQGGGFQTRAGLIPQNHKGLIIFEEFGKCNSNIVSELTDIRSSNEVRITRVSGTLTLPAMVRMISLSNVKTNGGEIKPIASYPNGINVITELVGTAEDIARYDLMLVLSDRGTSQIDPFWQPQEPLSSEVYQTRIRWVWSRTPEQIIITEDVGRYIIDQANAINADYDCHIKIFGTEAWKKLTRLAIAVAGYLVSTDDSYSNIIINKEHVDYAVNFFKTIYDNPTFKLKEYVEHERKYSTIDEQGIALLQDLYIKVPSILLHLEQETKTNKNMLMSASGLSNDDYNKIMNQLIRGMFVKLNSSDILPTERFRLGMAQINRNATALRVGELHA